MAIVPPDNRMKPSVTTGVAYGFPPALTVAVTAVGLLKHVGTATSVYLMPLPDWVTRTRTVAATPF